MSDMDIAHRLFSEAAKRCGPDASAAERGTAGHKAIAGSRRFAIHLDSPRGGIQCGASDVREATPDINLVTCRKCRKEHDAICEAQEEPVTPVIFRRFPKERVRDPRTGQIAWEGGDVVAIFPTQTGTYESWTCQCYQHVGQHGACDGRGFVNRTILAKPAEYADLKAELESIGYRLKTYARWQDRFDTERKAALKATGGAGEHA